MIEIKSAYRDYRPPVNAEKAIRRMIDLTQPEYLAGLRTVVLCNAAGLNHERRRSKTRRRGETVAIRDCGGLYHPKWKGEPAWIEIFVDNVLDGWPRLFVAIPPARDLLLGRVLFHELGHHIHATIVPKH